MGLLTREEILGADDCSKTETVAVPEWGGEVMVGVIGGDERDRFELFREQEVKKGKASEGFRALLVAMACRDENGKPIFKPEDVLALGKKSSFVLERVFRVAMRVNGIGEEAQETTEKNSDAAPSGDSG